jgi:Ca2+-binding RTX toxin-like protein
VILAVSRSEQREAGPQPVTRILTETRKRRYRGRRLLPLLTLSLVAMLSPAAASAAPANDGFANAQVITGQIGEVTGSNVAATKELGEPDHADNPGGHSIWYSWTAPADGAVVFTTAGSSFDTLLAAYTGAAVNALTPVAANDDGVGIGTRSLISFPVSDGLTYQIAVDGFSGKVGSVDLRWDRAPTNDNFANAEPLPSTSSGKAGGDNVGASAELGEPHPGNSIWYSWTAPADGTYRFDTVHSNFDTVLAVYTGASLETLDLVRQNDDDPDRGCCSSWVPLRNATAGITYAISVRGFDQDEGSVVLRWSPLILGTSAGETLVGTAGNDELRGLGGNDLLRGRGGADAIFGGRGNDVESGGPGRDFLLDRRGIDRLFGRGGADRLYTRDGQPGDLVAGGLSDDTCRADAGDTRRSC